jgi:hypothetical protein
VKRTILAVLLFAAASHAQTYDNHPRVLAGIDGGSIYGNDFLELTTGAEVPIASRFEADGLFTVAPLEHKVGIGFGTSWGYRVGGIVWMTRSLGVNGAYSRSSYSVTGVSKAGSDVFGGLTFRTYALGAPVRFGLDYVRQVGNRLVGGTESNYLQGGDFSMTVRYGRVGPSIARIVLDIQSGRVLNQPNPQCDGTLGGPITCPRTSTNSGGASVGVVFELSGRHSSEDSRF